MKKKTATKKATKAKTTKRKGKVSAAELNRRAKQSADSGKTGKGKPISRQDRAVLETLLSDASQKQLIAQEANGRAGHNIGQVIKLMGLDPEKYHLQTDDWSVYPNPEG